MMKSQMTATREESERFGRFCRAFFEGRVEDAAALIVPTLEEFTAQIVSDEDDS